MKRRSTKESLGMKVTSGGGGGGSGGGVKW